MLQQLIPILFGLASLFQNADIVLNKSCKYPMKHIFCDKKEVALPRLNSLYSKFHENQGTKDKQMKLVMVLSDCLNKCSICKEIYFEILTDKEVEKARVLASMAPDEIQSWEMLLDEDIRKEYSTCRSYPSFYEGFKAVICLIQENVKNNEIWKKVNLKNFQGNENTVFLEKKVQVGIPFLKGLGVFLGAKCAPVGTADEYFGLVLGILGVSTDKEYLMEVFRVLSKIFYRFSLEKFPFGVETAIFEIMHKMNSNFIIQNEVILHKSGLFMQIIFNFESFDSKIINYMLLNIGTFEIEKLLKHREIRGLFTLLSNLDLDTLSLDKNKVFDALFIKMLREYFESQDPEIKELLKFLTEMKWTKNSEYLSSLIYIDMFLGFKCSFIKHNEFVNAVRHLIDDRFYSVPDQDMAVRLLTDFGQMKIKGKELGDRMSRNFKMTNKTALKFFKCFDRNKNQLANIIKNIILKTEDLFEFIELVEAVDDGLMEEVKLKIALSPTAVKNVYSQYNNKERSKQVSIIIKKSNQMDDKAVKVDMKVDLIKKDDETIVHKRNTTKEESTGNEFKEESTDKSTTNEYNGSFIEIKKKKVESSTGIHQLKSLTALINKRESANEAIIIDSRITKDELKVQSQSFSEFISQNSNKLFSKPKPTSSFTAIQSIEDQNSSKLCSKRTCPFTTVQSSPARNIEEFYEECLALTQSNYPLISKENSNNFGSYNEYFEYFNALRANESKEGIRIMAAAKCQTHNAKIGGTPTGYRIKSTESRYEPHDLLRLTTSGNSFLAIVSSVRDCPETGSCVADIIISVSVTVSSDSTDVAILGNIVTSLREFQALLQLQYVKLLKHILWPSFSSDFAASKICWNQRNLEITENKSQIGEIRFANSSTPFNEHLQGLLVRSHSLNGSQAAAVVGCLMSNEKLVLVQGPPGTGKTTTIMSLVSSFLTMSTNGISTNFGDSPNPNFRILICAPSNIAIDIIVQKLALGLLNLKGDSFKASFIRVGFGATSGVLSHTLEHKLSQSTSGRSKLREALISNSQVVCTTLNSSAIDALSNSRFDLLIVDEACQSTELSTLIPLKFNPTKVILVGDPCQLPPTILSSQKPLEKSLFDRMQSCHSPFVLCVQYRMHPEICQISSKFFYNNKISTSPLLLDRKRLLRNLPPVTYIDIMGIEILDEHMSYYNLQEIQFAFEICERLLLRYRNNIKIVILTPYKAQASFMRKDLKLKRCGVEVNTIDAFQGQEADIIIFSTVRQKGIGFVADPRRINVAATRARESLIILGNYKCLRNDKLWHSILNHISNHNYFCDFYQRDKFLQRI